jgi:hypothetical protein
VRPKTIVYFDWIIFGTLLLGILDSYLSWDAIVWAARSNRNNPPVAFALTILIFSFVLVGALTLLVSRRRSKIATWVLIALAALVLSHTVFGTFQARRLLASDIIPVLQGIAQVLAYSLLFTPSARRWMRREDEKNEKLLEVFH